ncbi:MAG TPA: DUF4112 domain-containing protein [Candidatus Nanoarchaeia archaeon]|nr:DUF4112 domain-containing protein [Candidatus Nanoarchaeia archaeon]
MATAPDPDEEQLLRQYADNIRSFNPNLSNAEIQQRARATLQRFHEENRNRVARGVTQRPKEEAKLRAQWQREQNRTTKSPERSISILLDVVDFLAGFLPFFGDGAGVLLGLLLPAVALQRREIPMSTFLSCLGVSLLDGALGFVPGIGDFFDLFPSNYINQRIIAAARDRNAGSSASPTFGSHQIALWEIVAVIGIAAIGMFAALSNFGWYGLAGVALVALLFLLWLRHKPKATATGQQQITGRHWVIIFLFCAGISAAILLLAWQGVAFTIGPLWATAVAAILGLLILGFLWHFIIRSPAWRAYQQRTPNRYYLQAPRKIWGKVFLVAIVILILLFALPLPFRDGAKKFFLGMSKNPSSPMAKWFRGVVRVTNYLLSIPGRITESANRFFERQIAYATGDYYTGQVDANAKKKLGVYLEEVRPSTQEFEDTEVVTVWGTLTALTLNPDALLNIRLRCDARGEETGKYGDIDPQFLPGVTNLERYDLTCTFPPGKIPQGSDTVTITALFNFETQAYLKAYFIDRQRMQTLQRAGKDPLVASEVDDTHPIATYTNGPVMIGMEMLEPLVGLSPTQETKFRLGITIENVWEGKVSALRNLTLKIPDSMNLVDCESNKGFRSVPCTCDMPECEPILADATCTPRYTRIWKLLPSAVQRIKDIEKFESFSCRVKIDPAARDAVLGNVPLATHYFKVIAEYDYALDASTPITVKPSEGFNVYLTPAEVPQRQPDGTLTKVVCTGRHSDAEILTADYRFFRIPKESRNPDIQDPNTDAKLLLEGSTSCGETCSAPYTIPSGTLPVGETLLCEMSQTVLDSKSAISRVRYSCQDQCAAAEEGSTYNRCMEDCQSRATEEFRATSTAAIVNSKPVLDYELSTPSADELNIQTTVVDPDLNDLIGIGYQFEGAPFPARYQKNIDCTPYPPNAPVERRCTSTNFPLPLQGLQGETIRVHMTPDDGHTVGKTKIATYTVPTCSDPTTCPPPLLE